MKRCLATVLALGMCMIICFGLSACGGPGSSGVTSGSTGNHSSSVGGEAKEVQTVNVAMPTALDLPDSGMVQDAINAITEEKYGISFNFTFVPLANWSQQSTLFLTGDEIDVTALLQTPLSTYVNNGQLEPLDDYYANASEAFKSIWTDDELAGTRVNGSLYAISNNRNYGNYYGFIIDAEIAAEYGFENRQRVTMEEMDAFLRQVKAKYPDRYPLIPQLNNMLVSGWTWDGLGDDRYMGVIADSGQSTVVENVFETDDFRELVSWTRQWYLDGVIMQDVLSNTEPSRGMIANKKAVATMSNFSTNNVPGIIYVVAVEPWSVGNSYSFLSYAINANSSVKDAAWQAMEILYTDREIETLLCNGIEGTHYILNEDGTASYPEGKSEADVGYAMIEQTWIPPYSKLSHPQDINGPDYYTDLDYFNKEECLKSIATGMSFDSSEVVDEFAACLNVMNKYYNAILCGAVDTKSTIAQANSELEAAGMADVLAAKQAQLDDFLNSK